MTDSTAPQPKSTTLQIIETITALMTAAFGFVAALAWNTAIQDLVKRYLSSGDTLVGEFVYAIIVTVIAVIAIVWIGRVLGRYKDLNLKVPSIPRLTPKKDQTEPKP